MRIVILVLWSNKYPDSNSYLLIQQIQKKSYIFENFELKLKHQKLDKQKLTGKDCCAVVKDNQYTGGHLRSFDDWCWQGMDVKIICRGYERDRSSHLWMFFKLGVLKHFPIFTGKHTCWSLYLIKLQALRPATYIKNRLQHRCFSVNIAKLLRVIFSIEQL